MREDEDIWGSEDRTEEGDLQQEWQARQTQFHTLGYRDGVEAGKNSSVQEGFNTGYASSTTPGFNWGVARGLCTAFAALPASLKSTLIGDEESRDRLDELAISTQRLSSTDAQRSFYRDLSNESLIVVGISRAPEANDSGVWQSENNTRDRKGELEELERQVWREFEAASIAISSIPGS